MVAAVSTLLPWLADGTGFAEVVVVAKGVGLGVVDGVGAVVGIVLGVVLEVMLGKLVEVEISHGRGAIWIAVR